MPLDLIVVEIEKNKKYPDLEEGDFLVRSKDSKIVDFLRWLCGV